jgi:hypothetical protein
MGCLGIPRTSEQHNEDFVAEQSVKLIFGGGIAGVDAVRKKHIRLRIPGRSRSP